MKPAHSLARLLRDLKHHVRSVNPGSEPFQSGLKSIEKTAWEMLLLRNVGWTAIGAKTEYVFKVHTYVATPDGPQQDYVTPDRAPKPVTQTVRQRSIMREANKTVLQYRRNAQWIMDRYEDALEADDLNDRMRLRCLTGRATFEALVKSRSAEVDSMMAGGVVPTGKFADFVARHGQAHIYRDSLYATEREVYVAMREDSLAIPLDHDLIVDYYERAFTQAGGFDEAVWDELVRYMRSKDHADAVNMTLENGADKGKLNRHDQIVLLVATAERKLAALSDPLPSNLHTHLGTSQRFLFNVMVGHARTKEGVRLALRTKMYELCPSKRPKPRRGDNVIAAPEPSTLPPSMAPCAPGCGCVRHQEAQ